jgi:dolichol kinase
VPDAPPDPAASSREPSSGPSGEAASRRSPPPAGEAAADAHDLPYRAELRRKALHLLALALPLGTALLGKPRALYVLVPGALFALSCDVLRSQSERFARRIRQIFGPLMRADEWDEAAAPLGVRGNGATWTLVTMALLALFFPVPVAVAAFSLFMIGDAAAALVGRRWGRTPWGDGPRTVEGTAAFVGAGLATVALLQVALPAAGYAAPSWGVAALAVGAGAGAEALPRPLNDNLRVPLVAALALYVLG